MQTKRSNSLEDAAPAPSMLVVSEHREKYMIHLVSSLLRCCIAACTKPVKACFASWPMALLLALHYVFLRQGMQRNV